MGKDDVPLLRADATDDDLGEEKFVTARQERKPSLETGLLSEDSEDAADPEPDTVEEPEPARKMVPVVVQGVLHGYREEE